MMAEQQEQSPDHPVRVAQERAALRHLLYVIAEHPDVRKALDQAHPATGAIMQAMAAYEATEYEAVTRLHHLVDEEQGGVCYRCGCPVEVFKRPITDAWDATCTNSRCPEPPEEYGIRWIDWDEEKRIRRAEEEAEDRARVMWDD